MNKTAQNLIYLRKRCEIGIEDVAMVLKASFLTVEAWENKQAQMGHLAIVDVCNFYGIQKSELVLLDLEAMDLVSEATVQKVRKKVLSLCRQNEK